MSNDGRMPERIWADHDGFNNYWSYTGMPCDTEYIRADIHQREIERLERELEKANEWNERHKTRIRELAKSNTDLKKLNKSLRRKLKNEQ